MLYREGCNVCAHLTSGTETGVTKYLLGKEVKPSERPEALKNRKRKKKKKRVEREEEGTFKSEEDETEKDGNLALVFPDSDRGRQVFARRRRRSARELLSNLGPANRIKGAYIFHPRILKTITAQPFPSSSGYETPELQERAGSEANRLKTL